MSHAFRAQRWVMALLASACGVRRCSTLPVMLVSSNAFDRAWYTIIARAGDRKRPCTCLAAELEGEGLGRDAFDFFARTYSKTLPPSFNEYLNGDAWMDASFRADKQCKNNHDYGSNEPPGEQEPNPLRPARSRPRFRRIVRDGPWPQLLQAWLAGAGRACDAAREHQRHGGWLSVAHRVLGPPRRLPMGAAYCARWTSRMEGVYETCR